MGRTLQRAHFAIDAQVGHCPHFIGGQRPAFAVSARRMAQHIRLGPRRGRLVSRGAEGWAHALGRGIRAAMATTITTDAFAANFTGLPTQQRDGFGGAHGNAQGPGRHAGRRIDDFAWIEDILGVKNRLELPEHRIQRAVLPGDPGRPRQTGAVLRADGAAQVQRQRVDRLGDRG